MECVVVQDLFLNETANYAHVFLPGSTFLEKDGTFTNAERRINRVRKVMTPKNGYADWEVTRCSPRRWATDALHHPSRSWTRSRTDADLRRRLLRAARGAGLGAVALQREGAEGTPIMHVDGFVRGKGKFIDHRICRDRRATGPRFPLLLTTGRILSQYNVGAQTRRTENVVWHPEDRAGDPSARRRAARHPRRRLGAAAEPRRRNDAARADHRPRAPGVVYTTFHHPDTQANVITTDFSDWATNCPEYKVTAVQVSPSNGPTDWQGAKRRCGLLQEAG
jgi:formate dehydrogenase major subunit